MVTLVTARKPSLGQGNIFTSVSFLLSAGWVYLNMQWAGGCAPPRQTSPPGRQPPGGHPPPDTATEAGDIHPTGIHSYLNILPLINVGKKDYNFLKYIGTMTDLISKPWWP